MAGGHDHLSEKLSTEDSTWGPRQSMRSEITTLFDLFQLKHVDTISKRQNCAAEWSRELRSQADAATLRPNRSAA